jgi:hypothetical protein
VVDGGGEGLEKGNEKWMGLWRSGKWLGKEDLNGDCGECELI